MRRPATSLSLDRLGAVLHKCSDQAHSTSAVVSNDLSLVVKSPIARHSRPSAGGRVYFTVPNLFEVGVCLVGAQKDDGWFTTHFEFLIGIGGDATEVQGESPVIVLSPG